MQNPATAAFATRCRNRRDIVAAALAAGRRQRLRSEVRVINVEASLSGAIPSIPLIPARR